MRVLYFCNVFRFIPSEAGVMKKILAQCRVLTKAGNEVFLACPDDYNGIYRVSTLDGDSLSSFDVSRAPKLRKDSSLLTFIHDFILKNKIDVLYSRYSNYSILASGFYRKLRKRGINVLLEIPTYPISQRWTSIVQNMKLGRLLVALRQIYNATIGSMGILFFKHSVNRIVNNNGYECIWGVPTLPITNGVDVSSIPQRTHTYSEKPRQIVLLAVANVAHWHGYDRILLGLYEYYLQNPDVLVRFRIVGPGEEIQHLKKMSAKLGVEEYVEFLGTKIGSELDSVFNTADIGVSVLGVHRNNMVKCDSLKSREYCARCLPFITESIESQYNGLPFVLCLPCDESPIDINRIVAFYHNLLSISDLRSEMNRFAYKYCDWSVAFLPVVHYLSFCSDNQS